MPAAVDQPQRLDEVVSERFPTRGVQARDEGGDGRIDAVAPAFSEQAGPSCAVDVQDGSTAIAGIHRDGEDAGSSQIGGDPRDQALGQMSALGDLSDRRSRMLGDVLDDRQLSRGHPVPTDVLGCHQGNFPQQPGQPVQL